MYKGTPAATTGTVTAATGTVTAKTLQLLAAATAEADVAAAGETQASLSNLRKTTNT